MEQQIEPKKYCPDGTRRNPKTGNCEPKKEKRATKKKKEPVAEITPLLIADPAQAVKDTLNNMVEFVSTEVVEPKNKKYCPPGTRRNKDTGNCESKKAKRATKKNIATVILENPVVQTLTTFKPLNINENTPNPLLDALTEPFTESNETSSEPVVESTPEPVLITENNPLPPARRTISISRNNDLINMKFEELKQVLLSLLSPGEPIKEEFNNPIKIRKEIVRLRKLKTPLPVPLETPIEPVLSPIPETPSSEPLPVPIETTEEMFEPILSETDLNNKEMFQKEKEEHELNRENNEYEFLYPHINDPNFNEKIAKRKEFNDTKYDGKIRDIKTYANQVCKSYFELLPHQLFVKNFLSLNTPYNSLLLYHGLGTGKTCSAIGIAEEMRSYMKEVGIKQKIMVIASPNVQSNFRLQLFDENKLQSDNGIWSLNTCIGNSLLKEINPTNLTDVPRERIISQINTIINTYYEFVGYIEFANYIQKYTMVQENSGLSEEEIKKTEIKNIKRVFNNRLLIIDEVHNIRKSDDNKNKRIGELLMNVAKHTINMRLLLLSATPMYNNYKEIVWLTNLMNMNDKRSIITENQVFDKNGNFIPQQNRNGEIIEGGRELLERKLTGYVSYVRGENPYTFPYRIYPADFSPENTLQNITYPANQMNGKPVDKALQFIPIYTSQIGEYQSKVYDFIMNNLRNKSMSRRDKFGKEIIMPDFENMESFGYTLLQTPLEALNIVYPNPTFDAINPNAEIPPDTQEIIENMIGSKGLANIMNYTTLTVPNPIKNNYEYKPEVIQKYGRIFHSEHIGKYSNKIASLCESIRNSTGIVMVYSQYIDGGAVPIALALEEMGFGRYGSAKYTTSLFKKPLSEPIDARTMKPKSQVAENFKQAKYLMITGDKFFSPNNAMDIKYVTKSENKYGELVKVIIISKAGSEGLDFKNIRQSHILEPWYNTNRIEQIIGRAVRNLSHCPLPFEERNVEIYLHATLPRNNEEPADLYIYRLAEKKALQIGNVTRVMKENAVDCLLNIGQTNFTVEKLNALVENQNIELSLSSGKKINFKIGDKPFTELCDYMDNCNFTCSSKAEIREEDVVKDTYNNDYIKTNFQMILKRIRQLFKEQSFYKKDFLINSINISKPYPIEQIYYTLSQFVDNKNEFLVDKYGRIGTLVNKGEYYAFQPIEITDENASIFERSTPIDDKPEHMALELQKKVKDEGEEEKKDEEDQVNVSYEDLMNEIRQLMDSTLRRNDIDIEPGEVDWYKHANKVITNLTMTHNILNDKLYKYVLFHYLDNLTIRRKFILIKKIYSGEYNDSNILTQLVKEYFDNKMVEVNQQRAIVLENKEHVKTYIQSKELNTLWSEATKLSEKQLFEQGIMDKIIISNIGTKINHYIGFMQFFKDRELTFKIKDMTQIRNNKGSRCDRMGKTEIIKFLNQVLGEQMYNNDNTEAILKFGLCVILEIVLRHFNDMKKDNKVWFLDPERALKNNIMNYKLGSN